MYERGIPEADATDSDVETRGATAHIPLSKQPAK
jgi:hypothetical protein